ncbi:unnamed protein product [Clavelina lepadiformis]|uniref:Uncharacterized protein n=1 Tax=Clavelina lepadiformis TaxID=159417 RepID=A0ABP0FKT8_CLALP
MESNAVGGRKAVSSSAVDKLKKKKKKKRKVKEGKRSSASSNSATGSPDSDGKGRLHKPRSALSCPPEINQISTRNTNRDINDVCQTFNESLRWLPIISSYSTTFPPSTSTSKIYGPTLSRLNSNSWKETKEEEEERVAVYKMNRRKRYLAAQQALLDLYPDANVYAVEEPSKTEGRRLPTSTSLYSSASAEPKDSIKNKTSSSSFELAVPALSTHKEGSLTKVS